MATMRSFPLALVVCSLSLFASAGAFAPAGAVTSSRTSPSATLIALSAKPTFNRKTDRWEAPAGYAEEETYGPAGSLLRQGPGPFITRLTNGDEYEQAVLKYIASEGCSRIEAQANMDAYFNNAGDWAYQKMEEKRGAPKVDYNKIKTKDVALALVWGTFVVPFIVRTGLLIAETGSWDVSVDQIFDFSG